MTSPKSSAGSRRRTRSISACCAPASGAPAIDPDRSSTTWNDAGGRPVSVGAAGASISSRTETSSSVSWATRVTSSRALSFKRGTFRRAA
ncbi:putative ATP-grasp-modified RiPP [Nocardioides sp.]|uniref:putative ATP-grasp-modified RiPP n=1 Tax=Nocardioides sp. TaxID=35761 RepID=UPI0035143307